MCTSTRRGSLAGTVARAALIATFAAAFSAPALHAQGEAQGAELDRVRAGLQKYQDPVVAIHDGYFSTLGCIEIAKAGGPGRVPYKPGSMGVHFLNVQAIGPAPDPSRPQVLIYEPVAGKLHLVAAEWFIPLATGVKGRPWLLDHPFDGPMEGHHPLQPKDLSHYDLHVWLFKSNPHGMFDPTNPTVKCTGYPYRMVHEAPRLVPEPKP